MRYLIPAAALAAFTTGAFAQDKITLANGDVLTGKITTMADGTITISSPLLGDLPVPIEKIRDMSTGDMVRLETKSGDLWQRRIVGIEGGSLVLAGGETTSLSLDNLGKINPPEKPEPTWTGSLRFTGVVTNGNTERRSAGLLFNATRATDIDRISVDALWDYGDDKAPDDGDPTTEERYRLTQRRAGGGLKYDYFLSKRWYALATTRVLGDTLANLRLRFTAGAGLGYTLLQDDKSLFLVEAGLSYLSEDYRVTVPPDPSSRETLAARIAYRYERQLSKDTRLTHRVEAFPSTEEASDIYLQAVTELSTALTESMVAALTHQLDYDNTPASGRERADNRVTLSVGWTF